jgi:quercetin 2,3-dioxygenase
MITVRPSADRGQMNLGWLDTRYTFSFNRYYDPDHMGFRSLRVINEDYVKPGTGFGTHPHNDMEIVTYIFEGELEHRDSTGGGSVIRSGDIQRITAGTGVTHSEMNPSSEETVHLLQIWLQPDASGYEPGYEEKTFPESDRQGQLRLIVSNDGRDGSIRINQDADIYASLLSSGDKVTHEIAEGRGLWLQNARGEINVNGTVLHAGDGAAIEDENGLDIEAIDDSELILFDLA